MLEPSNAELKIAELLEKMVAATSLDLSFTIRHHPGATPDLTVEFTGPDTRRLIANDAELLKALEHVAAKVRGLTPEQHNLLSFDAEHYKSRRDQALRQSALRASNHVRDTGQPFTFPAMSSHERRQLHLVLNGMGLRTESTGEGLARRLILYPPGDKS